MSRRQLFIAERFDGIEPGGLSRGEESQEDAHSGGESVGFQGSTRTFDAAAFARDGAGGLLRNREAWTAAPSAAGSGQVSNSRICSPVGSGHGGGHDSVNNSWSETCSHTAVAAVAGDVAGGRPPEDQLHEKTEDGLATTHVQHFEESTCAREVGTTNQLEPEDSSLQHPEITCNSFTNNGLCRIVRVLNATPVGEGGSCRKPSTVKEPENPCLMFSSPQSTPAAPGPAHPADRP